MIAFLQQADFNVLWGIIVPASVLLIAVGVTWKLYKHFSGK